MQVAPKSLPEFVSASISHLATEPVRLEIAGIESWASKEPFTQKRDHFTLVDDITEKVWEKIKQPSAS